jgi:GAF domain-containing protein
MLLLSIITIVLTIPRKEVPRDSGLDNYLLLSLLVNTHTKRLKGLPPREIFSFLLHHLLVLTNSEYGFIGDIVYPKDGDPYLKTWAITDIAWSEDIKKYYDENIKEGLEFRALDTLFGSAILTKAPVISNNPISDPRAGNRRPDGHPDLNCFLGLPIFYEDKMIGMVGLANRPEGYPEGIIDYLDPFVTTAGSLLMANRRL